jgi:hypothetical protein
MFRFIAAVAALLLSAWLAVPAMAQPRKPSDTEASDTKTVAVSAAQSIRLERSGPTRIALSGKAAAGRNDFRIPAPRGDGQTYLVLKGISAEAAPGVSYDVYLDLPPGRAPGGRADRHYVGTFNFFDTSPGHRREARLNITQQLKALADAGQLSATPTLTVVPGAAAKADSQIGSVAIEAE